MTVVAVMVPLLQKGWKRGKLLRLMQETAEEHPLYYGNARMLLQNDVQKLLAEQKRNKAEMQETEPKMQSDSLFSIGLPMSEKILREQFPPRSRKRGPEAVVLLLGDSFFPEEQMKGFVEMIQPYLPWVNALTVICEPEEAEDSLREPGYQEAVIQEYTEALYYEYGLVSQILCGKDDLAGRSKLPGGQSPVLFLDYGHSGGCPFRMMEEGDVYLDITSSEEKEALFRRKCRGIFYQSPRKYLDTMVKSGYDK